MLQQIRPYCRFIVYLLLISYGSNLCSDMLYKAYYSVAYTAKVLNAEAHFWGASEHHHSQELALLELEALQRAQEKDSTDEPQRSAEKPNQKLKFFNRLEAIATNELLMEPPSFPPLQIKPSHFMAVTSPPPRT